MEAIIAILWAGMLAVSIFADPVTHTRPTINNPGSLFPKYIADQIVDHKKICGEYFQIMKDGRWHGEAIKIKNGAFVTGLMGPGKYRTVKEECEFEILEQK